MERKQVQLLSFIHQNKKEGSILFVSQNGNRSWPRPEGRYERGARDLGARHSPPVRLGRRPAPPDQRRHPQG